MKNKLVMGASAAAGVILVFLAVFAGIQKAQINALNSKIDNQTAIINRVIGENIPVVVPEKEKAAFDELRKAVKAAEKKLNDDSLDKAVAMYLDFIKNTAPWIQETMANEILNTKYDLDFLTIKIAYVKDNNAAAAVVSLQEFIELHADYESIADVKAYSKDIASNLAENSDAVLVRNEKILIDQVKDALGKSKLEIINMKSDITFKPMVTLIAAQLASLKHDALSVTVVDNKAVLSEIDNCITLLRSKEREYDKMVNGRESEEVKTYNANALNYISDIKKRAADISVLNSEKKQKRLSLILELESIQLSYLYQPVGSLYQEVYAEIWNGLDSETRFEAAKKAITIEKKDLDDKF